MFDPCVPESRHNKVLSQISMHSLKIQDSIFHSLEHINEPNPRREKGNIFLMDGLPSLNFFGQRSERPCTHFASLCLSHLLRENCTLDYDAVCCNWFSVKVTLWKGIKFRTVYLWPGSSSPEFGTQTLPLRTHILDPVAQLYAHKKSPHHFFKWAKKASLQSKLCRIRVPWPTSPRNTFWKKDQHSFSIDLIALRLLEPMDHT